MSSTNEEKPSEEELQAKWLEEVSLFDLILAGNAASLRDKLELLKTKAADANDAENFADIRDDRGRSALDLCSIFNRVDCAAMLIEYGASVDAGSKCDYTALHTASMWGQVNMVKLLLEHDSDIRRVTKPIGDKTQPGETSMQIASRYRKSEVCSILHAAEMDLAAKEAAEAEGSEN